MPPRRAGIELFLGGAFQDRHRRGSMPAPGAASTRVCTLHGVDRACYVPAHKPKQPRQRAGLHASCAGRLGLGSHAPELGQAGAPRLDPAPFSAAFLHPQTTGPSPKGTALPLSRPPPGVDPREVVPTTLLGLNAGPSPSAAEGWRIPPGQPDPCPAAVCCPAQARTPRPPPPCTSLPPSPRGSTQHQQGR
jgi:hypothetical protein